MDKIKNLIKKDLGVLIAALFSLVLGIYRVFFETQNRTWSIIFGFVLIIAFFVIVLTAIRELLKSK